MHFFSKKYSQSVFSYSFIDEIVDPIELPMNAKTIYISIITKMHLFVKISSLENFIFADELFYITFVS